MEHIKGVYQTTKKDGSISYRSSITYKRKHISLGSFESAEQASFVYMEASAVLANPHLTIQHYNNHYYIPFDKWVCLINYRDNGIYFATPIYLRKSFFYYYLTPDIDLKFDLEDLFYYSTRKIMRRNNHLFVADYGMQVNIANRYGIKNYSVLNRDYFFINGDIYDFRMNNIEITNPYMGVIRIEKKGIVTYKATIHVKSNYVIGYYSSVVNAAIAYNKAIDILKKNGCTKQYTPNYVEGISNAEYAQRYTQLEISDRLYSLIF